MLLALEIHTFLDLADQNRYFYISFNEILKNCEHLDKQIQWFGDHRSHLHKQIYNGFEQLEAPKVHLHKQNQWFGTHLARFHEQASPASLQLEKMALPRSVC